MNLHSWGTGGATCSDGTGGGAGLVDAGGGGGTARSIIQLGAFLD